MRAVVERPLCPDRPGQVLRLVVERIPAGDVIFDVCRRGSCRSHTSRDANPLIRSASSQVGNSAGLIAATAFTGCRDARPSAPTPPIDTPRAASNGTGGVNPTQ